jgi:hypothetical protein
LASQLFLNVSFKSHKKAIYFAAIKKKIKIQKSQYFGPIFQKLFRQKSHFGKTTPAQTYIFKYFGGKLAL